MKRFVAMIGFALGALPLFGGELNLQLDKVYPEKGGLFEFTKKRAEPAEALAAITPETFVGISQDYDVWAQRYDIVESREYGFFTYEFYVRPKNNWTQVTHFNFQGKPTGTFDDFLADVPFTITEDGVEKKGTIILPILGENAPEVLRGPQFAEPADVDLAEERDIDVPLTNALKKMAVNITSASARGKIDLWKPIEVRSGAGTFKPYLIRKGETDKTSLKIRLNPNTRQAFVTALIRGKSTADDTIKVSLTYKTLIRDERSLDVQVPVHFIPWPPYLLLIAVLGSVAGWLVLLLIRARKDAWKERFRILGAAAVAALFVEVFGMILQVKGELKIFNLQMDPFQLPTAAVVGVLAGLAGNQSLKFLRRISKMSFFRLGGTADE